MSENISISAESKAEKYQELLPQIEALIAYESDTIANLANISAALKEVFGWLWVGFYRKQENYLILGPFQGPLACTRIPMGKGVCGTSASDHKTIVVENVNEFEGHIACSSASKSEIVIPILKNDELVWILDIDSDKFNDFDNTDKKYLESLSNIIAKQLP